MGLIGDAEAEGAAREGRAAFNGKEEDNAVAWSFHETVLLGKLWQAVRRATDREGRGCLLQEENAPKPGDRLQRYSWRSTRTCVSPLCNIPHVQPSRSMVTCPKRYLSTSQRMMSRGSYQSSLAQQVRWEQR